MDLANTWTIGIDLGGTNAQLGVVDSAQRIVARMGIKTHARDGCEAVLDRLAEGVRDMCRDAGVKLEQITAIGIAAPGAIDMPNGIVLEAPNLGWKNVPLRDLLQQRTGRPIVVDNDVNAAAWGEYKLGAAQGSRDCLGVWLGTGVGGGLVLDGHLHHGSLYTAGEFGQQVVLTDDPKNTQIIEDHCSRTGMSRLIQNLSATVPDSVIASHTKESGYITSNAALAKAWNENDVLAVNVVHHTAKVLGIGIANVITLLALECVVIGGGVTESLGQPFIDLVRQSFDTHVFPQANRSCKLILTSLAADAGLLGAAMLAVDSIPSQQFEQNSI